MTGAALLVLALVTGGIPCPDCGQDGQPLRPGPNGRPLGPDGRPLRPGLIYHHACDGGKCFSCQRPLWGPSAPPFNYRLVFNYPWSQAPCYPAYAAAVPCLPYGRQPEEPVEAVPAPLPCPRKREQLPRRNQ